MSTYVMSAEEQAYLAQYDIARFERPSLAVDIVLFAVREAGKKDNYRKLQPRALKVLMIRRAGYPYKNLWALPGGFCRPGEDVQETAMRELYEETHVNAAYLQLAGTFGEEGRDPRGWIISNTFLSLVNGEDCKPRGGSDAWVAAWFSVELTAKEVNRVMHGDDAELVTEYELKLYREKTGICPWAVIREYKQFTGYHEKVRYEIVDSEGLAFDHGKIILHTLLFLRKNVENDWRVAFDLLPETFTLTRLQNTLELVLDDKLLAANFRRKVNDLVIETDRSIEGSGHRPAKLFKRNVEAFCVKK